MNLAEKEKKTGTIIDDTDEIYELSKYYRDLNSSKAPKFHKPKYQLVKALITKLSYENVIEIRIDELCDLLGTTQDNLTKRLNTAGSLVEYYSHRDDPSINVSHCRLLVNPNYGWKKSTLKTREQAVKEWYLCKDLSEESKTDFSINPAYVALKNLKI